MLEWWSVFCLCFCECWNGAQGKMEQALHCADDATLAAMLCMPDLAADVHVLRNLPGSCKEQQHLNK